MASGTVYGPPPTRKDVLGAEMSTCADPMPLDVVGTAGGEAAAPGCDGCAWGGCPCGGGCPGAATGAAGAGGSGVIGGATGGVSGDGAGAG
jgi:hypothetical protein